MKRRVYSTSEFETMISAANSWESVKHHLAGTIKYHQNGALLGEIKEQVSSELFKDGHHGAATHLNCLIERLLEELANAKEEIEFLSKNLN